MNEAHISFNEFLEKNLNAQQKKAVEHENGSLLVIAGAGSGKTRIITARITHLILNKGIDPRSIVALTFTNKAAREMSERIEKFLSPSQIPIPIIGTFHSYCLRILKRYPKLHGIENFSILDDDDQVKIISSIIGRIGHTQKLNAHSLVYQISQYKNENATDNNLEIYDNLLPQIVREYEKEKYNSKCYDFDDLLLQVLQIFRKNKSFKKEFQKEISHVLVDEYQDTNKVQHALLKEMTTQNNELVIQSVCAVGDEDQSIYSWRGATIENILRFKHDFKNSTCLTIEQNYRSVQPILDIANHVISNNRERNPKNLWSAKKAQNRVVLLECASSYHEGEVIAQAILQTQKKDPDAKHAILYRTHYQSRTIEEAFIRHSIAYTIIGGIQFYERKEIKDIISYLRLIANPYDRVAFTRIINCPARSLGDKFQDLFYQIWETQPLLNFRQMGKKLIDENLVTKIKKDSLNKFIELFNEINEVDRPTHIIEKILNSICYINYLKETYNKDEAEEKIENIRELVRAVHHFEQNGITNIRSLLEEIALMQEKTSHTKRYENNPTFLMTLHAAKGLEFDIVAIAGLEEGLLPSSRARFDSKQLEEERRLFYVGITRAKEYLLLTHCQIRNTYGSMNYQIPSRFLKEIPKNNYQKNDCSSWPTDQAQSFFLNWFSISPKTKNSKLSEIITFGPAKKALEKEKKTSEKESITVWKINQIVGHNKFGMGTVKKIIPKSSNDFTITVQFKSGTKKVASQFLKKI